MCFCKCKSNKNNSCSNAKKTGPKVLVILDGYGIGANIHGNAIAATEPNFISNLAKDFPSLHLKASGEAVGLPAGQIGNSEVGHLHIGAGRIIYTGLSLINKEVEINKIFGNVALLSALKHAQNNHKKIHILGLLSAGGVHSHQNHIFALIKMFSNNGVNVVVHAFGDGRDVAQKSIINDIKTLKEVCEKNNAIIGSISGRYYAMDRDSNFERTMKAYNCIVQKDGAKFSNPVKYIEDQYAQNITDEFLVPAYNESADMTIEDGDSVIFANFRPDRARQLSHLIYGSDYYKFNDVERRKNLFFVIMMNYEGIKPSAIAYPPQEINNTLGKVIADNNMTQLRIAETEKYAHVTFFFDGGKEIVLPKMDKVIIPSPKVATYDLKPEMSAAEITDKLIKELSNYDFVVINYANADMVGHTGILPAAIQAIKVVNEQVQKLYEAVEKLNGVIFLTADHGNAEIMIDQNNEPATKHTANDVYLIISDKNVKFNLKIKNPSLANIAPTILKYLGLNIPKEMDQEPLI